MPPFDHHAQPNKDTSLLNHHTSCLCVSVHSLTQSDSVLLLLSLLLTCVGQLDSPCPAH